MLVNGRTGDPALYVATLFERRAILFDLGDISALAPRRIHRLDNIFVSHTHIDHFVGFDQMLRVLVGREKRLGLYGPDGFIAHVRHKLHAYHWNLVERYSSDLVFEVTEIDRSLSTRTVQFRFKTGFAEEAIGAGRLVSGIAYQEAGFRVSVAVLEHNTLCLGFAVEENVHVNVWKNRLAELGLPVGPWLRALKRAVIENRPDDYLLRIAIRGAQPRDLPLRALRSAVTITPGQKIAYVTDVADTPVNREAIVALAGNANIFFIEAAFAAADAALAVERAHLTTIAAGEIARTARAHRIEPFHFSPRYAGQEERMLREANAAFTGISGAGGRP
jgi:ribonuclease Z